MRILTIESTCDETAAAIIDDSLQVLSSVVASQEKLHQRFNGVVPEIAARAHVERILPVLDETLRKADLQFSQIDAVAVANTPGLSGSLLIGLIAAKAICLAHDLPLIAINHLYAHVFACQLQSKTPVFPCVGFIVSGGHSSLYLCRTPLDFESLGGTIDDAAGEAFDKVASMLGLGYPGGPAISRRAANGNPQAYAFPRSFIHDTQRLQFSFSGLKTAVRYAVTGVGKFELGNIELPPEQIDNICASFEVAVIDCLVAKAQQALDLTGSNRLCVGGGVAANRLFRQRLTAAAEEKSFELHIAPPELCTDNAVMGAIAIERYRAGLFEQLDLDILPGLIR
jgi:N6-L-threonylcarbamoyladenine synthase